MKKKVALLIDTMNNGGAQRVVSRLSEILSLEYDVFVILFEATFDAYQCSGQVISMNVTAKKSSLVGKLTQLYKRRQILLRLKREHDFDIVISFLDSPNFVNLLSQTTHTKEVISIRNFSETENQRGILGYFTNLGMKVLYNRAHRIVPVSKVISNSLIRNYKLDPNKLRVIYNPYNVEEINHLADEQFIEEHEAFFSTGEIIITVGRHMYQKGFWHLIKAFKQVKNRKKNAKLVIVGRDEQNGKVEKLVEDLGLSDSVLLLGFQNNPFKFIKRSKVYVLTSLFEGFPNALVEAMACGCPVVAVDCKSGPREILDASLSLERDINQVEFLEFGVLSPALDKAEDWDPSVITESEQMLSGAIVQMLEKEDMRQAYCLKSFSRAKDFSYTKCKEAYQSIVEELTDFEG